MKMGYAIVIRFGNQWCHRDDIFGIVVLDGTKITKLTLIRVIVGYDIRSLHIDPFAFWLFADKINFASLKLSDHHFIAHLGRNTLWKSGFNFAIMRKQVEESNWQNETS